MRLEGLDRGLNMDHVQTFSISLPRAKYVEARQVADFYEQVLERIRAIPGVEAASAMNFLPLSRLGDSAAFTIEGRPPPDRPEAQNAEVRIVAPDYFRSLGIPVLEGRPLNEQDTEAALPVAMIDRTMAQRWWPNDSPVGQRIRPEFTAADVPWAAAANATELTIVGVAGEVREEGVGGETRPSMFLPLRQSPSALMNLIVRAPHPEALAAAVREAVWAVDAEQPVGAARTLEDTAADAFVRPRIVALLLGLFAVLALVLAVAGVYGVLAYTVAQRAHEIGIRMSLGAQRGDILKLVLVEGGRLLAAGLALGLGLALALGRALSGLLFGISTADPATFLVVSLGLAAVGLAAILLPARRASRVEAIVALRCE